MTESQRKALNKYRREKVKQISLKFYPSEAETYEYAKAQGASKIKALIERDRVK